MPLPAGTRLGPYEIVTPIGAGGMGEVYRARDTKLDRDVALKILPESFASDPDRVMRFTREARTLASLNHPNIAAIYGIEESGAGVQALVMELVEGDDLSATIARGALPLSDALPIAKQIADALEAAHDHGIVHRDLKPANIKLRTDGTVKVLDFGLAKALDPNVGRGFSPADRGAGDDGAAKATPYELPTMTSPAMTALGMILGTAAYMAPEQAKGKAVDRRADIWAFGVVLHEMLSGQHLFLSDSIPETLAHVMTRPADLGTLPDSTPPRIRDLIARCLEKDPKKRLRDIGEARLILEDPATLDPASASSSSPAQAVPPVPVGQRALPWAVAGVCASGLVVALLLWAPWRTAPAPAVRKVLAGIGVDASMVVGYGASAILSPDGNTLVFVARSEGAGTRLYVRTLDALEAKPLAGTEDAMSPFFSPAGDWIGFFAGTLLKKVAVTGGAAIPLCEAPSGRGGTWTEDNTIIFTPSAAQPTKLMRVSAEGGTPAEFGAFIEGGTTQRWPQALPGGRAVLYTEHDFGSMFDGANIVVAPLSGGAPKVVVRGGYYGRYVPSGLGSPKRGEREGGHVIYIQQGTLFAAPFDLDRLETTGQAKPVLEGIAATSEFGSAHFASADDGTLVYIPGTASEGLNPIDWMTSDGKTSVLRREESRWSDPAFSPDGKHLAMTINDGKQRDIWVYELASDTVRQLTFDAGNERYPVWTLDSRRIVFASDRAAKGTLNLYWTNADGTGEPTRLTTSPNTQVPASWHPDGRRLAFHETRVGGTSQDLMLLPIDGDEAKGWTPGTPTVLLATPARETAPMFSPDGRWLAFTSGSIVTSDIYVRSFPDSGGQRRVSSANGGAWPQWSRTSPELLFATQNTVMVSRYTVTGDSFTPGKVQSWSPTALYTLAGSSVPFALHPDGKRLALRAVAQIAVRDKVVFLSNFFEHLRTIAPGR